MRFTLFVGLLLLARVSMATEPVRYLSVVNDSPSDIQSIEISAPGMSITGAVTERHPSLRGGETVTWGIQVAGQCMRDLLVAFNDEQRVIVRDLDICTDKVLHTRQLYVAMLRGQGSRFDAANIASAHAVDTSDIH